MRKKIIKNASLKCVIYEVAMSRRCNHPRRWESVETDYVVNGASSNISGDLKILNAFNKRLGWIGLLPRCSKNTAPAPTENQLNGKYGGKGFDLNAAKSVGDVAEGLPMENQSAI